jgi:uncharacterized protein (DUF1499 family)
LIGKITLALIAATVAFIMGVRMIAHRAPRPDRIGVAKNQLIPCPDTPNCVNSFEGLDPFIYKGDRQTTSAALIEILGSWPRTEVIRATEEYIHVEFRSRVFSFIDDGEFYFPSEDSVIHYRSAARSGRSDFGVNGQRIKDIGSRLQSALE